MRKLTQLYQKYDRLWNLGTTNFRNEDKRQAAQERTLEIFGKEGFGVDELRNKYKILDVFTVLPPTTANMFIFLPTIFV